MKYTLAFTIFAAFILISAAPATTPKGFEIREVSGESDARQILELVAWRWQVPARATEHLHAINEHFGIGTPGAKARCWAAWRAGVPVAKVILHLAAGAAGIYGVATRPEARGLGLARTLTLEALRAARQEGYQLSVLHSSPMALRLYEKIGFRSVASFKLFASPEQELHL